MLLRAYVACGLILWDALSEVQLVKIHIASGKLTLMEFDDFDASPLPLLRRRIKVNIRKQDYDLFEYDDDASIRSPCCTERVAICMRTTQAMPSSLRSTRLWKLRASSAILTMALRQTCFSSN